MLRIAGNSESNIDRRERLRKLALETIDLAKVSPVQPSRNSGRRRGQRRRQSLGHTQGSTACQTIGWRPADTIRIQDPYILRTHLGTLECRLCLTLHVNEGSYLAHTQGKKHQTNLARRAAQENRQQSLMIAPAPTGNQVQKKTFVKIGRPG